MSTQNNNPQSYFQSYIWPGLGLFGESYLLFSIGTLDPIWSILYPQCYDDDDDDCPKQRIKGLSYNIVSGIMIGMIVIGFLSTLIGRRGGSILTASLMAGCSVGMLLLVLGVFNFVQNDPNRLFQWMGILLFGFGMGVGGEYPLSASSASEKAMEDLRYRQRTEGGVGDEQTHTVQSDRGKRVILIFSMQGMGIFIQSLLLTILLLLMGQLDGKQYFNNDDEDDAEEQYYNQQQDYDLNALLKIWKIIYAIGAMTLLYVVLSRIRKLEESEVWAEDKAKKEEMKKNRRGCYISPTTVKSDSKQGSKDYVIDSSPHPTNDTTTETTSNLSTILHRTIMETKLLLRHYGMRLFGTSMTWFLWDVAFYGNKLFQSAFILALMGDETTLFEISGAAALNALIALLGYYAAAHLVDRPFIGRRRLQQYGFTATGTLFSLCAILLYQSDGQPPNAYILLPLYLLSSFFGQCGPNCTTFLLPAEIFPTEARTACHGLSASAGKLGALLAAILFPEINHDGMLFWISGLCSFVAAVITLICIPDTTTLDLYELDKEWRMLVDDNSNGGATSERYSGPAVNGEHLSLWERKWQGRNSAVTGLASMGDGVSA